MLHCYSRPVSACPLGDLSVISATSRVVGANLAILDLDIYLLVTILNSVASASRLNVVGALQLPDLDVHFVGCNSHDWFLLFFISFNTCILSFLSQYSFQPANDTSVSATDISSQQFIRNNPSRQVSFRNITMPPTPPGRFKLRTHTVKPLGAHTHTVIFLHDRGSTATEFALELFESSASATKLSLRNTFPSFKWVFPFAPLTLTKNRNTAANNVAISQWFDIWSLASPQEKLEEQRKGLSDNVEALVSLIQHEISEGGIAANQIFLAGMSQGIALAIHAFFRLATPLAGVLGFCGWMPFASEVDRIANSGDWQGTLNEVRAITGDSRDDLRDAEMQLETVVYLAHSRNDRTVPIENGIQMRDSLEAMGLKVQWHEYGDGAHWFQEPVGIDDLVAFLRKIMAKHYFKDKRLSRPETGLELVIPDEDVN